MFSVQVCCSQQFKYNQNHFSTFQSFPSCFIYAFNCFQNHQTDHFLCLISLSRFLPQTINFNDCHRELARAINRIISAIHIHHLHAFTCRRVLVPLCHFTPVRLRHRDMSFSTHLFLSLPCDLKKGTYQSGTMQN